MADPSRDWLILKTLQTRLQTILTANDYRTDIGQDVRTESAKTPPVAPMITLYFGSRTFPPDAKSRGERDVVVVAEARIPASLDNAQETALAVDADIEQALDAWLYQPGALPLRFEEAVVLDRPDGVAEVVVQHMYSTSYRR